MQWNALAVPLVLLALCAPAGRESWAAEPVGETFGVYVEISDSAEPATDADWLDAQLGKQAAPRAVDPSQAAAADERSVDSWIVDSAFAPLLTDWTHDPHVERAQFQPSILPDATSQLRIGGTALSPTTQPLATTDVLASLGLGKKSPVVQVSALQPLLTPTATGIDSLLIATRATSGQKRQPTASEIVIAGRRKGQTPGGSHWIPTREDLDSMLSKIDSRLVRNVTITEGPYEVREGPGLAFVDVELLPAPLYANGYESHGLTSISYQTNGEQWHGRQSFEGGSVNWGYRIGYTHLTGNDYEAGDGTEFLSSYNSRLPDLALTARLTENSRIDFHYLRMDQTDVEFPGQVFDIDWLSTDAYQTKLTVKDQAWFDELYVEGWYNRTRFEGTASEEKRRRQTTLDLDPLISGQTDVDAMTAGGTAALTWDGVKKYLTVGADFRFAQQRLNEQDELDFFTQFSTQRYAIPRSDSIDPGIFFESEFYANQDTRTRFGGRVDQVNMDADDMAPGVPNLEGRLGGPFDRDFTLWSLFAEIDRDIGNGWSMLAAAGHSMRPPTMSELYAVEPFLATLPQFIYNSPLGNPTLDPERLWQIDVGLDYESDCLRGGIRGFHGWIQDYITFDQSPDRLIGPNTISAFTYTWTNTDLATLTGGRGYLEYDQSAMLTWLGNFSYVEGRDRTRRESNSPRRIPGTTRSQRGLGQGPAAEPLPVIPPLEAIVGVRLHDPAADRWAIEFLVRMVDNQDRVAESLSEQVTPGFTTVDARGYWAPADGFRLTAGVENIGNRHYQEHFDPHRLLGAEVFRYGRNFYFGIESIY